MTWAKASHLKTDSIYIHRWSKRFLTIFWNLSCSLHKRRNSPTFILHVQGQWWCMTLTFAYKIEPKTTLRWHKSIYLKAIYVCIAKSKWFKKIFEKILIKMSILRTALRVIKWNRISTFKDLNVLEVVLAIPLQEKYDLQIRQHTEVKCVYTHALSFLVISDLTQVSTQVYLVQTNSCPV